MIAFVRMQLLRWRRRTLGGGLLVAAVFLPTILTVVVVASRYVRTVTLESDLRFTAVVTVLVAAGMSMATQVSVLVQEEPRLGRSTLLRVGGLDGYRAMGAFVVLGLVLAFLHGTLGYAGPALVGLFFGVPLSTWLVPVAQTVLVLSAFAPPAALAGFLLPRNLSLALSNVGALVAAVELVAGLSWKPGGLSAAPLVGVLLLHALCLVAGGWIWRSRSASSW